MGSWTYILIWEDGTVDVTDGGFDDEWQAAHEAGILEVVRMTDWPDQLSKDGFAPVPR